VSNEGQSPARRLWGAVAAVAAAATGLALLVYLIGAATLWLALRNTGYSPDIGIQHQPRSQVIALGLRGLVFVGFLAIVLVLATVAARRVRRVREAEIRFRYVAVVALLLLFAASWTNWRLFGVAIAAATLLLAIGFQSRFPRYGTGVWRPVLLIVASALTALSWQLGGPVNVNAVFVKPRSQLPLRGFHTRREPCGVGHSTYALVQGQKVWLEDDNACLRRPVMTPAAILDELRRHCEVPYFGESGSFVYLGGIANAWDRGTGCDWDAGPIVELRRDKVLLRFSRGKARLNTDRQRPIAAAGQTVAAFLQKFF
jgi:hypothetical protein